MQLKNIFGCLVGPNSSFSRRFRSQSRDEAETILRGKYQTPNCDGKNIDVKSTKPRPKSAPIRSPARDDQPSCEQFKRQKPEAIKLETDCEFEEKACDLSRFTTARSLSAPSSEEEEKSTSGNIQPQVDLLTPKNNHLVARLQQQQQRNHQQQLRQQQQPRHFEGAMKNGPIPPCDPPKKIEVKNRPELLKEPNLNQKQRRGLRKRMRSRGHGTLNMADIENAKAVDLNQFDIKSESINKEFGTFGALPVGSKKLWDAQIKLARHSKPETYSLNLQSGTYKYIISLNHSRGSFFGDSKEAIIKIWLLNKQLGHSKFTCTSKLTRTEHRIEFDLVVREKDCKPRPMELRTQFLSEARFSNVKLSIQLHKVNQVDPELVDPLSNLTLRDIVLDGEDQSDMIRRTRVDRAKSVRLKRQLDQARKNHRRAKSVNH